MTASNPAGAHPGLERLLDYWFGDTDDAATDAIDAHLLHCDACGAALDGVVALVRGVRGLFAGGQVGAVVEAGFVDRLIEKGLRVHRYEVPCNGSVACSVAPAADAPHARAAAGHAGRGRAGDRALHLPSQRRRGRGGRLRPGCTPVAIQWARLGLGGGDLHFRPRVSPPVWFAPAAPMRASSIPHLISS